MKKLKLNPVVLDTLDNDQLKRIMGGAGEDDTEASAVMEDTKCQICEVVITRVVTTTTTKAPPILP